MTDEWEAANAHFSYGEWEALNGGLLQTCVRLKDDPSGPLIIVLSDTKAEEAAIAVAILDRLNGKEAETLTDHRKQIAALARENARLHTIIRDAASEALCLPEDHRE